MTDHELLDLKAGQSVTVTRCLHGGYAVSRAIDPMEYVGEKVRGFTNAHDMCAWLRQSLVVRAVPEPSHVTLNVPGWEYETTTGPRKAWWVEDEPPEGDGWERNVDAGRNGWERFDYHEESYWRRPVRK